MDSTHPGLRRALLTRHARTAVEEKWHFEDLLDMLEHGCDTGRTFPARITQDEHPLMRKDALDATGLFTRVPVEQGDVIGCYSGVLMPTRALAEYLDTLTEARRMAIWTYDYASPRLSSGEHTFHAARVR